MMDQSTPSLIDRLARSRYSRVNPDTPWDECGDRSTLEWYREEVRIDLEVIAEAKAGRVGQ